MGEREEGGNESPRVSRTEHLHNFHTVTGRLYLRARVSKTTIVGTLAAELRGNLFTIHEFDDS